MADEAKKEVMEDADVEGQRLRTGPASEVRLAQDGAPAADEEFPMSDSDLDVEGQRLRNRNR